MPSWFVLTTYICRHLEWLFDLIDCFATGKKCLSYDADLEVLSNPGIVEL